MLGDIFYRRRKQITWWSSSSALRKRGFPSIFCVDERMVDGAFIWLFKGFGVYRWYIIPKHIYFLNIMNSW